MAILISHLPDEIEVGDDIVLRAKSKDSYPSFAEVIVHEKENLSKYVPWAIDAPNQSSIDHYFGAPEKKATNVAADYDIFINLQFVGAVGAMNRTPESEIIELGYWLSFKYHGRGIMTKSVVRLTDVVFENTDTPAIEIGYQPENKESEAVAVRSGFDFYRNGTCTPSVADEERDARFNLMTRERWMETKSQH